MMTMTTATRTLHINTCSQVRSQLKIIQWNARSLIKNKGNLIDYNVQFSFDIALISETWLKNKHKDFNIPGYNIVRNDRIGKKCGGAAMLLKNDLAFQEMKIGLQTNTISIDICAVYLHDVDLVVVSVYKPPEVRVSANEWAHIFSQFGTFNVTIGGDFNFHHNR